MTPEDIRSQRFTTRLLHGLSPEEVSAFLEDVAEAFGNIQHAHASLVERVKVLEAQGETGSDREVPAVAGEREASASSHLEVLRAAALREVEALLHDAQARAQALLDGAQAREAAMRQEAEARADALLTTAREQEGAIRGEIDRLTQSRVQLVDEIRDNLETYQQWLGTMDPRGRARGRRDALEPSNGDPDHVDSADEARVS